MPGGEDYGGGVDSTHAVYSFLIGLPLYHSRDDAAYIPNRELARFARLARVLIRRDGGFMEDTFNGPFSGSAVLFDLDGTLVDTAADLAASMNHALAEAGLSPVPAEEVRHLVGYGARRMLMRGYQLSTDREADDGELEASLDHFLKHYGQNIAVHSRPFDGVIEMIEGLRARGVRCAVCTNKRETYAVQLLDALGLTPLFDAVVGVDTAVAPKPDAAPVLLCLEKTQSQRGVFVGDSDTDIRAAKAAGMSCFIARFGYGPLTLVDEASALFDDYHEGAILIDRALTSLSAS